MSTQQNTLMPNACHCGADWFDDSNRSRFFKCGSVYYAGFNPPWKRSMQCMEAQIDQLKEKLEAKP